MIKENQKKISFINLYATHELINEWYARVNKAMSIFALM